MSVGAIILCGGKSSRMTVPKATLPFGRETLLERVVRICAEELSPIVVVAASQQTLPPLDEQVLVTHDRRAGRGPLEGLSAGLAAIQPFAEAAYVTSCDVPFLNPEFIRTLVDRLDTHDVVVPCDEKYHHPLAAVYRTSILPDVEALLAQDRMRPLFLFDAVNTLRIRTTQLRHVDPDLRSLMNLNQPADYFAALELAGLHASPELRERFQSD
ncbi:MAG: molybdopterin-guanine dinucleotide biosynthesis protein A [Blastopirellula sp.]|nr:molybdopterin-guanine dinucleotide biosynthesis protein A [Blastopirellula sp.]